MKRYAVVIMLLGLVLGVNLYFRLYPASLPQLKSGAKGTVERRVQNNVIGELAQNFPAFGEMPRQRLLHTALLEYKARHRQEIKRQVQEEYEKAKGAYQDAARQTYLMELDCWHWARYVDNVVRLGHPGDEARNGRQFDKLMLAPWGADLLWDNFLYYSSAALYKVFCLFKPVPLFTFLFYLPLLFAAVLIIALYFFALRFGGHIAAIICCLFVGLAPVCLQRTCAGWFDKDTLNLIFPLLIAGIYPLIYSKLSLRRRIWSIFIAGFLTGLFAFTWIFWWFIAAIIFIYEIFSLLNLGLERIQYRAKNSELIKQHVFSSCLYAFFSFFWITVFCGLQPLAALYDQLRFVLALNKPLAISLWPNVYSTVGELKQATFSRINSLVGGTLLFVSALCATPVLFLRSLHDAKYAGYRREAALIMAFWFISMFFACFQGIRFVIFLLIPLGISLGWIVQEIYDYIRSKKQKWVVYPAMAVLVAMPIINALQAAADIFPLMDASWNKALTEIRDKTPQEAVVNSWWDFGDWFKAVSRRKVIFDGQSQNIPQAYWMANVLITGDEEEGRAILRMLNNGGNKAFEVIDSRLHDPLRSVLLLKKVFAGNSEKAKGDLLNVLPAPAAEEVQRLIFARPARAYFVVDYSMQTKIPAISFLGNWDFVKAYLAQNIQKAGKTKIVQYLQGAGIDNKEAPRLYQEAKLLEGGRSDQWVSRVFRLYSGLVKGQQKNGVVTFDNGLIYKLAEQTVYLYSCKENHYAVPESLFVPENGALKEIAYTNGDLNFSVLIWKENDEYRAVLLDRALANSLFVRLYFLGGEGMKYFKPFVTEQADDGFIRVFEIEW